ncbi:MAG: hypothetical protein EOO90_18950 [Pedobacter sp.]|nr:MAG: hypothetical protein EOO90_18950 [Pedobacter sp.]
MKKILLVSPFPPSQNPRLVKEFTALKSAGYEVKAIYAERDKWASKQNTDFGPDFILVGGKIGSFLHLFTRLLHKVSKRFLPYAYSYHRTSLLLLAKAKQFEADLYIGHDLTTLPIVVKAAQKNNSRAGFDAEDFHRNEVSDDKNSFFYQAAISLENKYIPMLSHLTTSSPLISSKYNKLYPGCKAQTIYNAFPAMYIAEANLLRQGRPIRLFWFSQTIGRDRGIEIVIEAMSILFNFQITLTLLGMISREDKSYFEGLALSKKINTEQLLFLEPVKPEEIFVIANKHDIGLALEQDIPYNRNICLTNKMFTYLTAGLAIIATKTQAQEKFLSENPEVGLTFAINDQYALVELLNTYLTDIGLLNMHKMNARNLAVTKFNWDIEAKKLLAIIDLYKS